MKTLVWNEFMRGEIVEKETHRPAVRVNVVAKTAAAIHSALIPTTVFAADGGADTWNEIFTTVLNIADWLCVGVIIFSGVTWMFGNRTKAIEFIMGGSIGYLIIRHAVDIRNWLRTL